MSTGCIDESKLRKAIQILKNPGELFEVRIISNSKKAPISGYFTDADTLLKAFTKVDLRGRNVYITLNELNDVLYSREQHDRFVQGAVSTNDTDVLRYRWFFIDLDPERISGVSSTDEQLRKARLMMAAVEEYLTGIGFSEPVKALSGNGYHLLYKVDFPNTEENEQVVVRCLQVLADIFDNDDVKIDTVNSNPSRICKLHGTLAQKGANTQIRPHRMSEIISEVKEYQATDLSILKKLAAELPDQSTPTFAKQPYEPKHEFNLLEFMDKHGLTYSSTTSGAGNSTIYLLDKCPFDPSHTNGDAKIFHYGNGAIAFKCHHRHCRDYRWQDVRKMFEPDAYDHPAEDAFERIAEGYQQHKAIKKANAETRTSIVKNRKVSEEITEDDLNMPVLSDFEAKVKEWLIPGYIPKGCVTLLCSDGGIGKTTLWCDTVAKLTIGARTIFDKASNIPFNSEPCDVMYFSKEDPTEEVLKWKLQRAGANQRRIRLFSIEDPRISKIYYGSLLLERLIQKYRPQIVVFDTLQAFLPDGVDMAKRKDMRDALNPLNQLGAEYGTAFLLIMHTNKSSNSGRQRMADSSDIWDLGRSALMAGMTKDAGIMYLSHEKCNYGKKQKTILFSISEDNGIEFQGTTWKKDRDFVSEGQIIYSSPKKDEAKEFILDQLQDGNRKEIRVIEEAARAAGIAKSTLQDARAELVTEKKIKREKVGFATSTKWYLLLYPETYPK